MAVQDFLWLVDRLQRDEAVTETTKNLLGQISEGYSKVEDKRAYLKDLYKVVGLSEFSMAGLWFLENKLTTDIDANTYERIKIQIGDSEPPTYLMDETTLSDQPVDQQTKETDADIVHETVSSDDSMSGAQVKGINTEFGMAFERFVVAMQTGDAESKELALHVIGLLEGIKTDKYLVPIEQEVTSVLHDLLSFITKNDIMDDVRVMNLLLNFEDSMNHAIQKEADEREGFLHEALDVIKEYRTLFE